MFRAGSPSSSLSSSDSNSDHYFSAEEFINDEVCLDSEDDSSEDGDEASENIEASLETAYLQGAVSPYLWEPEVEDNVSESETNSSSEEDDISIPNMDRIGNISWCVCSYHCKSMSRPIDCLCCREIDAIPDEFFEGNRFFVF